MTTDNTDDKVLFRVDVRGGTGEMWPPMTRYYRTRWDATRYARSFNGTDNPALSEGYIVLSVLGPKLVRPGDSMQVEEQELGKWELTGEWPSGNTHKLTVCPFIAKDRP